MKLQKLLKDDTKVFEKSTFKFVEGYKIYLTESKESGIKQMDNVIPNFKLKLATQKKFTWRLVVQAFFRVVVNPIFDKSYFFRSRFLGSFR
ncbi:putative transcriptional regulator [Streptococcus pneumoniae]|nr:putative transcriptional regulator [Streptococcus pneumoniae]